MGRGLGFMETPMDLADAPVLERQPVEPAVQGAAPIVPKPPSDSLAQPTWPAGRIILGANPRRHDRSKRNPKKYAEFRQSVKERGVDTPVLVRWVPELETMQMIAGYGRLEVAILEHGPEYPMPIRVLEADDREALLMAFVENYQRTDITPIEEAETAAALLGEYAGDKAETAKRLGLSMATLNSRLALLNAVDEVRDALIEGRILLGHAELLAGIPKEFQGKCLSAILSKEKLPSVAEVRASLESKALTLANACFEKSQCLTCPFNSDAQASMFEETIGGGLCTNASCYRAKEDEFIEAQKARLADEFPRVQEVTPGDNHIVIRIVADGPKGVGAEQAAECRACGHFGAAISRIPGHVGQVYTDQCFDTACHARKRAKHLQADSAEAPGAPGAPKAKSGKTAAGKPGPSEASKGKARAPGTVSPTGVVHEYRAKLWRHALISEMRTRPQDSIRLLVSLGLTNNASKITSSKYGTMFQETTGSTDSFSFDKVEEALAAIIQLDKEKLTSMLVQLSTAAIESLSDKAVCAALRAFSVDLAKYFTIDAEFLKLLTKSEMEVMAKQVGLADALGEQLSKVMSQKKDQIIQGLLAAPAFNYSVVPSCIEPSL